MKLEFLEAGSSDCPLIRLYDFSRAEAQSLRQLVKSLCDGSCESASLSEQPWIETVKGCRLTLRSGNGVHAIRQLGPSTFECVRNGNQWSEIEGLLDPFCESDRAGFQWLLREGKISILFSTDGRW